MSDVLDDDDVDTSSDDGNLPIYSPWSATEAPGISLIIQMRIYDVLMAILTSNNKEAGQALMEIHAKGGLLGSLPYFDPSLINVDDS